MPTYEDLVNRRLGKESLENVTSVPTEDLSQLQDLTNGASGPGRKRKNFSAMSIKLPMDEYEDKLTETRWLKQVGVTGLDLENT